ncbi:ABC exporter transmembrane subunit, DevC protein [Clostridioides difficile]|nr:ABC exporter transmembrane subunit, DevC protein [Clostridioides difficile]
MILKDISHFFKMKWLISLQGGKNMKKKLNLSNKYIKAYKGRSISISISIILSIALIVGVSILNATNNNLELQNMRYENGIYSVNFEEIDKNQIKMLEKNNAIENFGLTSVYKKTSIEERQSIDIVGANNNYITSNSKVVKGRLPGKKNEMVAEEWVLRNFGIKPEVGQEITLKVYNDKGETGEEKFKLVGIISDRALEKSAARLDLFIPIDLDNYSQIQAYVSFKRGTDIYNEVNKICKTLNIKDKNTIINRDMADLEISNASINLKDMQVVLIMSFICGIVIYGIFNISIYKRISEYGILRAVGYNNFKILKLILQELLSLYSISIPIGLISGTFGAIIFNNLAGSVSTQFIFNGEEIKVGIVLPVFIIVSCLILIGLINILIAFFTYRQVKKISVIDSIKKNLSSNDIKKNFITVGFLKKYMKSYKAISFKNIFRNKKSFVMIVLSMSICGILFIILNYKLDIDMLGKSESFKSQFMNSDFMIDEFASDTTMTGISYNSLKEISSLKGVKDIETSMVMPSRLILNENEISNKVYFKNMNDSSSDMYYKMLLDTDKSTNELVLKNNIKGYNDAALKKTSEYLLDGNIDIDKMKKEDLAVLYLPQIIEGNPRPQFNNSGKSVLDTKVGDKIKVKFRSDKNVSSDEYWLLEDFGKEYDYRDFTVGAIVYYPYMNETSVIGYSTAEVIISEERFRDITGIGAYTSANVNVDKGIDDKKLEKEISKITSKDKDVITRNIIQEKENVASMHKKSKIYNLGITFIVFTITMVNIINNIGYNIIARTNEFGILRAIGLNDLDFKKMIIFEGLLYGIISSVISIIISLILQEFIYNTSGVKSVGVQFNISYIDYLTIIIMNLLLGFITTYVQARKFKDISIIECISKVD